MIYDPPHFDKGDFVRYEKVEYYASDEGDLNSHIDMRLAFFIKFLDRKTFDACQIYILSESKFATVSAYDLALLSKNE